jgi:hypothetical protein
MRHPYSYKHIGNISQPVLEELKTVALAQEYLQCPDFHPEVIKVSGMRFKFSENDRITIGKVYRELARFIDPAANIGTNIACMYPNTYLLEHSDYTAVNYGKIQDTILKIQIPIITNDKVAMMWREDDKVTSTVAKLIEGGIYIVNNVRFHSAINLSDQNRYFLTIRFKNDAVRDFSILE